MKVRKIFKKTILAVLTLCLILAGVIGTNTLTGKAKTTDFEISTWEPLGLNETCSIKIRNGKSKAKYTYSSSNKQVATVSKKGVITAKKIGKTNITVKETYKGKTKKLGTFSEEVKDVTLKKSPKYVWQVSSQTGYWNSKEGKKEGKKYFGVEEFLSYPNAKATYKVYSSAPSVLKLSTDGTIQDAKGEGEVTITFKETYQKKTRDICSIQAKVSKPVLKKEKIDLEEGDFFFPDGCIGNGNDYVFVLKKEITSEEEMKKDWDKLAKMKEKGEKIPLLKDDILDNKIEDSENIITAQKAGTRYLYYGVKNYEKNTYETLGYIVVTVADVGIAKKVSMMWEHNAEIYDRETGKWHLKEDSYNPDTEYEMEAGEDVFFNVYTEPYRYTGELTVEIEDTDIVSSENVFRNKLEGEKSRWDINGVFVLHAKKPGVTRVTVHANGASNTFKVNVYEARTYKTNQMSSLTFYSVLDQKDMVEKKGQKGWKFESSNTEIVTIRDYSGGECVNTGTSQGMLRADAYFDTHEKEGETTISAYYNNKLVGQTTITVKKE